MGNLVTTLGSIWSPLITSEFLIPYIYHPLNFSSNVPFNNPSALKYALWYYFFNCIIVFILSVIGNIMSTKKNCNKYSLKYAMLGTRLPVLLTIIGLTFIYIMPILKAPLLICLGFLPYSKHIVTGIYLAFFVFIGGYAGNNYTKRLVCV